MRRALNEFVVAGVSTLIPLHQKLVNEPDIVAGKFNIHWLTQNLERLTAEGKEDAGT